MTWTYTPDFTASRDKVRFLIQDTDTNDRLVTDEEIAFILTQSSNIYRASEKLCRSIALSLGRKLTLIDPAMKLDRNEQYQHYLELADKYKAEAVASGSAGIFAGGISIADKDARADDADRVVPGFGVKVLRIPGTTILSDFD
jgi:hypothetical protein